MEVIIIPSSVEPVGVSVHVLNLARLLSSVNLLDTVLCPSEGWLSKQLHQEGLPYQVLDISYDPLSVLDSSLTLFRFLKTKKPGQVVHLHGRFPTFLSILSMVTLRHLQFVVTMHQFGNTGYTGRLRWKNWLETFILKYLIKRICCVSDDLKNDVTNRLGGRYSNKVFVIKNWIHPLHYGRGPKARAQADRRENRFEIVAVGRLSPEKGFDILINAAGILIEKGFSVTCDIFGDGPEKPNLAEQISRKGLEHYVRLRGVSDKVRQLLPHYDVLVIPSRLETFGLVVLEAYDAGLPVVASNTAGLRENVLFEKTGLLFESGSAKSLSNQIIRLIRSPELCFSLAREGKKFVKNYYPDSRLLTKYLRFYGVER